MEDKKLPQEVKDLMQSVTNYLDKVIEITVDKENMSKEDMLKEAYDTAITILENCRDNGYIEFND